MGRLAAGGCLAAVAAISFLEARRIWSGWDGAGVMPLIAGSIFGFLSIFLPLLLSQHCDSPAPVSKREIRTAAVLSAAFLSYLGLMIPLGFFVSTWLFLIATAQYFSRRPIIATAIWTGIVAFSTHVLFVKCLGMYLPGGLFTLLDWGASR